MQFIDIYVLTETKLDDTFPTGHILVKGYSEPYRLNTNKNDGGVMIYTHEDIPSKHVFHMIWKVNLLNSILGNVNGYFLEHTTHHSMQIFIILII